MRLGVATPGVSLATVRDCLTAAGDVPTPPMSVVRARRCGKLDVSLQPATTLTVCIRRCAVSIHTAERVLERFNTLDTGDCPHACRVHVVDGRPVPRWLRRRFDCLVRSAASDSTPHVASENQHMP